MYLKFILEIIKKNDESCIVIHRAAKLPLKKELIPITITCFKM
jgi:hypothetical protein